MSVHTLSWRTHRGVASYVTDTSPKFPRSHEGHMPHFPSDPINPFPGDPLQLFLDRFARSIIACARARARARVPSLSPLIGFSLFLTQLSCALTTRARDEQRKKAACGSDIRGEGRGEGEKMRWYRYRGEYRGWSWRADLRACSRQRARPARLNARNPGRNLNVTQTRACLPIRPDNSHFPRYTSTFFSRLAGFSFSYFFFFLFFPSKPKAFTCSRGLPLIVRACALVRLISAASYTPAACEIRG